jgi:hypothetical protein
MTRGRVQQTSDELPAEFVQDLMEDLHCHVV